MTTPNINDLKPLPRDWKDVAVELHNALKLVVSGKEETYSEVVREAFYVFQELQSFDDWVEMVIMHELKSQEGGEDVV